MILNAQLWSRLKNLFEPKQPPRV